MKFRSFLLAGFAVLFSVAPVSAKYTTSASCSTQDPLKSFIELGKAIQDMVETVDECKEDGTLDYLGCIFLSVEKDKPVFIVYNCKGELNEPVWKKKKVKQLLEQYEVVHINYEEGEKFRIVPGNVEPEFYYRRDLKTETLIKYLEDGLLEYAKVKERESKDSLLL